MARFAPLNRVLTPLRESSRGYSLSAARADVLAGLTVAVVAAPQCMAYALIAGVPVEYGLYSVILQSIISSLFNSQRHVSVGPMITQSLLVASTVTRLEDPGNVELYLQLVVSLTLLKGLIQFAMAGAGLGGLARYVSHSVLVGFTAGAAVLIAAGQVHWFLGAPVHRTSADWPGLIGEIQRLWRDVDGVSWPSIVIGVACVGVVLGLGRLSRFAPGPLVAIVLAGVAVAVMGWGDGRAAPLVSPMPSPDRLLTLFAIPELTLARVEQLLGGAVALALLSMIEMHAVGKSIAAKAGGRVDAGQDLFSQGLTHTITSFFQCMPASASFSRSALNHYVGAKTAWAGVFNGVFVLIIMLVFAPWARFVPMASLAAILFVIAAGLIDWGYLRRLVRGDRGDAIVCLATFLATLTVPLAYAVFVGIVLNLALFLRRAGQLHMSQMVRSVAGPFEERPITDRSGQSRVVFLSVEGDLFFAVADELQDRLGVLARGDTRVVIIRVKRTHSIDATVIDVLERFVRQMRARNGHVLICGLKPELAQKLRELGLHKLIGEDNLFEAESGVFTSAKLALARARRLVGATVDVDAELTPDASRATPWNFEI